MNIKYISLLSFFCAMTINATENTTNKRSLTAMLNQAKKARNECSGDCIREEIEYCRAKAKLSNFCFTQAKKKNPDRYDTKDQSLQKNKYTNSVLEFEYAIYDELGKWGLDSLFDDYKGSLEDYFRIGGGIRFDLLKDNPTKQKALREASENIIQTLQEQPAEDSE